MKSLSHKQLRFTLARPFATYSITARRLFTCAVIIVCLAPSYVVSQELIQVAPNSGNTKVYKTPTNVPVVDINTPTSAGLSHNKFSRYSVDSIKGVVLNNGNASQSARQSVLAGQVLPNLNLNEEAKVILNEVAHGNPPSVLAGFTEVLGSQADVIVANPNGITCSGCGFINTPRATLTTGMPQINNGAITGYNVERGLIRINGSGLNGTKQQLVSLVGRAININGQINAQALDIIAGANHYNPTTKVATAQAAVTDPNLPRYEYAIDSSALGGKYANRIRLVATEAGVGVRMRDNVVAAGDDFTIDTAGRVRFSGNHIKTERGDIRVNVTATGDRAIAIDNTRISAGNDLSVTAAGEAQLRGGLFMAGRNLDMQAARVSDESTNNTEITDNNRRFAQNNLNLTIDQDAALTDVEYRAADTLNATTGTATLTGNTVLRSSNDLKLTTGAGSLQLSSAPGTSPTIQSTAGSVRIDSAQGFTNSGTVSSDQAQVNLNISGTLHNQSAGIIRSKGTTAIVDFANSNSGIIENDGIITADGQLSIRAKSIDNRNNGSISTKNNLAVQIAETLENSTNGVIVASGNADIQATTLRNADSGEIKANSDLDIRATDIINSGNGAITANGTFTIRTATLTNNNSGNIATSGNLNIRSNNDDIPQATRISNNNTATIVAADDLNIQATTLINSNSAEIRAEDQFDLHTVTLTNNGSGTLASNNIFDIYANNIGNTGNITANGMLAMQADTTGGDTNLTITNDGSISTNNHLNLYATTLNNNSSITSRGNLTVQKNIMNNEGTTIDNKGTITSNGNAGLNATTLTNHNNATIVSNADLTIQANTLTNNNDIQGQNNITINAGKLTNNDFLNLGQNTASIATLNLGELDNTTNAVTQSAGSLTLLVDRTVNNTGRIFSMDDLSLRAHSQDVVLAITNASIIEAIDTLTIGGTNTNRNVTVNANNASSRFTANSVDLRVQSVNLNNDAMISSRGDLSLTTDTLALGGSASSIIGASSGSGTATIDINSELTNVAAIHSGQHLSVTANSVTNTNTGGISALGNLSIGVRDGNVTNQGALYAGDTLTINAGTFTITNEVNATVDSSNDISLTAAEFRNYSDVRSGRNTTIDADRFRNEVVGGDTRQFTFNGSADFRPNDTGSFAGTFNQDNYTETQGGTELRGDVLGIGGTFFTDFTATFSTPQSYAGETPTDLPLISAGTTLTIKDFESGTNLAGILSAQTIDLQGKNPTATFLNDDLSLVRHDYSASWVNTRGNIIGGITQDETRFTQYQKSISNTQTIFSPGAGILAQTINAAGFNLTNAGSPQSVDPNAAPDVDVISQGSSVPGRSENANTATGTGVSFSLNFSFNFPDVNITLPTNPNGFFVQSQDSNARFLIETNPRFSVGSPFVSSDFLTARLGYDIDQTLRRLGDSNYEAELVRKQLLSQTGTNIVNRRLTEQRQLTSFYENAAGQAKTLGLAMGQPLTEDQQKDLTSDIVWLVETEVAGHKVLAPVVYLSESTRSAFADKTATIAADNSDLNVTSFENRGGSVSGREALTVNSEKDIKNISGTITGGDVQLSSTTGSVENITLANTTGGDGNRSTVVGKTAAIRSTGKLDISAKEDITTHGGTISAGTDATLNAQGNIRFDSVEKKTERTTSSGLGISILPMLSYNKKVTRTTEQQKSTLSVGGNLNTTSGNNTDFAATDVTVQKDATIRAGENLNITDRHNTSASETSSSRSGLFVGGGLYGSETETTKKTKISSVGSTIKVGGDANLSGKNVTLRGADLTTEKGDISLTAKDNVRIEAGKNVETTTVTKKSTTFLSFDSDSNTESESESNADTTDNLVNKGANADAEGSSEASAEGQIVLYSQKTSTEKKVDTQFKGSNIDAQGGNISISAGDTLLTQGAQVEAQGDIALDAKKQRFEAVENTSVTTKEESKTSVGLYASGESEAEGEAGASANRGALGGGAQANADGSASAEVGVGLFTSVSSKRSVDGSSNAVVTTFKSGGSFTRTATQSIKDVGTNISVGKDFSQSAQSFTSEAASNRTWSESSSSKTTAKIGAYADSNAAASAGGAGGQGSLNQGASGSANASAGVSAGLKISAENERSSSDSKTSQAVVSKIQVGGNFNSRTQKETTLTGTQIDVKDEAQISAGSLEFNAAENTNYSYSSEATSGGEFKVGKGASFSKGTASTSGGSAGWRGSISGEHEEETKIKNESTAVVGTLNAGNLTINTKDDASFEGSKLKAKNEANLNIGGDLEFKAAENVVKESKQAWEVSASIGYSSGKAKGGSDSGKGLKDVTITLEGGYEKDSTETNTAVVGAIATDSGKLNINAGKNAKFEGTAINGGSDVNIAAKGNVDFNAAQTSFSGKQASLEGSINYTGAETKDKGNLSDMSVSTGFDLSGGIRKEDKTTHTGSVIKSNGNITVKAGEGDVNLSAAELSAAEQAKLSAGGKVNIREVKDTSKSYGVSGSIGGTFDSKYTPKTKKPKVRHTGSLLVQPELKLESTTKQTTINAKSVVIEENQNAKPIATEQVQ